MMFNRALIHRNDLFQCLLCLNVGEAANLENNRRLKVSRPSCVFSPLCMKLP